MIDVKYEQDPETGRVFFGLTYKDCWIAGEYDDIEDMTLLIGQIDHGLAYVAQEILEKREVDTDLEE